jgi:hypothetical protein
MSVGVSTTRLVTVIIRVDDLGLRVDGLGDLVSISRGWQAQTDIQKLADPPLTRQVPHRPGQKGPVRPGAGHHLRTAGGDFLSGPAVGGVRVLPPDPYG